MDKSVTVSLVAAVFPNSTTAGNVVAKLLAADGSVADTQGVAVAADGSVANVVFANVVDGTYTVSAERQDASGATLGTPAVSAAFTVSNGPTTVSITVPSSVTVA